MSRVWIWCWVVFMPLGWTTGCATNGSQGRRATLATTADVAPPDLPEPHVLPCVAPSSTLDPFLMKLPLRPACAKPEQGRRVQDNATVDPFCLSKPLPPCTRSSPAALMDDSIIDPFCQHAGNGS